MKFRGKPKLEGKGLAIIWGDNYLKIFESFKIFIYDFFRKIFWGDFPLKKFFYKLQFFWGLLGFFMVDENMVHI
ncbi:MAG: hypothetical protein CM15mP17_13280 [Gammaproteobacteria bacterium]|nr:MAG: hypothetical protein CM15mP17_13280 [Gammaproteobacteria bacterium]